MTCIRPEAEDNAFTVQTLAAWTTSILEASEVDITEIDPHRIDVLFLAAVQNVLPEEVRWDETTGILYRTSSDGDSCRNCIGNLHYNLDAMSYVLLAAVTSELWRPFLTMEMDSVPGPGMVSSSGLVLP